MMVNGINSFDYYDSLVDYQNIEPITDAVYSNQDNVVDNKEDNNLFTKPSQYLDNVYAEMYNLRDSTQELLEFDFKESSNKEAKDKVKDFVENYNKTLDILSSEELSLSNLELAEEMDSFMNFNQDILGNVGINITEDKGLEFNENNFPKVGEDDSAFEEFSRIVENVNYKVEDALTDLPFLSGKLDTSYSLAQDFDLYSNLAEDESSVNQMKEGLLLDVIS